MTVKELLSVDPRDIDRMTEGQLREAVRTLADAANKRLKRLGETEIGRHSPAYEKAMKRSFTTDQGGKFGTQGKNRNQLRSEYKAAVDFLNLKTSSVSGWKKTREKAYKKIGGDFGGSAKAEIGFWSTYRKLRELYPTLPGGYGSDVLQTDLRQVITGGDMTQILMEINDSVVSKKRRNRDEYLYSLSSQGYVLNEKHRRVHIDRHNKDDIIYLFSRRIDMKYEAEQREEHDPSEEFFEI